MREGFDREIDSLLRRTARAATGARGNGAHTSRPDTHLDADELAAFAEGALPEAARLNAVSHLADCGECRALAVNLTRAAGVEAKLEKSAAAAAASPAGESKSSRGWFAALFAPRTLRYVTPLLAVCLVAVVSFIALRSRSDSGLVSLQKNTGASPSVATTQDAAPQPPEASMNANSSSNANVATTGTVGEARDEKSEAGARPAQPLTRDAEADAPVGSAAGGTAESKAAGNKDEAAAPPPEASKEDAPAKGGAAAPSAVMKSAPVQELPAPKSADNTKAGPPPQQVQNQNTDDFAYDAQQQKRAAPRNVEQQSPDGSRNQSRAGSNNSMNGGALASTPRDDRDSRRENAAPTRRGRSVQNEPAESERGADADAGEEARAVAGHRFRRQGGAWVDVNYKSSMSSTGVRRGTDAYRALVADIPEIGRAAEQLGGEVVVVVRGRAYRIR